MTEKSQTFLLQYRITAQLMVNPPAELPINRKLSNNLDIIKSDANAQACNYLISWRLLEKYMRGLVSK